MNSQTRIALTADELYAFEGKTSGDKLKIVGSWPSGAETMSTWS
jgi:hypothetical protein